MKILLNLIVILVAIPFVSASSPDFTMSEILEDEAINGANDFGDLLFVEDDYLSETHIKSDISTEIYQQYDILSWSGNSIKISEPNAGAESILVNGSEYYLERYGTYLIVSMTNSSITAPISVNPADDNAIEINNIVVPTGFELEFSQYNFNLNNERTVSASLNVDDDVESGDYEVSFDVNNVEFTKDVEILEVVNWTVDTSNISTNATIKAGEGLYLGRIIVENIGNQDVEITTTKSGNETGMIGIPQPQTLYRKNVLQLDFQAQVPSVMKAGIYEMTLHFSDGDDITREVDLNITVVDTIAPTIEEIEFSSDFVFVDNEIKVIATDNDDVVNLTIEYDGEKLGFLKDGNQFTRTIEFRKLSRYIMNFCATDNEGNKECEVINKTFSKIDAIEGNERVLNMDSMRFGKYSNIFLFNITEEPETPIVLTLNGVDVFPKTNQSLVYRVIDEDGAIKTFGKYDGEVLLDEIGAYYFEVRADAEVSVNGVIRVELPEQYEAIQDITFKVEFKEYDVPKDFSVNWVEGRKVVCDVKDTGNLDTSYYDCNLKYPIDTRAEDISVPTTVSERNNFEGEADEVRDELDKTKLRFGLTIGITLAILLILILYTIYMILWHPYVRIQGGKTSGDRKLGIEND